MRISEPITIAWEVSTNANFQRRLKRIRVRPARTTNEPDVSTNANLQRRLKREAKERGAIAYAVSTNANLQRRLKQ